jgi:renalase
MSENSLERDGQDRSATRVSTGKVAIIGAGLAGLTCARTLIDHGVEVTVFDKGRAPGGRLSGVRSPDLVADLGAPYFTARDPRFVSVVETWLEGGIVARWEGRVRALGSREVRFVETPQVERFVGTPSMNAIARHLGRDVLIAQSHRVDAIVREGKAFLLEGSVADAGRTLGPRAPEDLSVAFGVFDVVLVCLPSDQVHPLLSAVHAGLAERVARHTCDPCLALAFRPDGDALAEVPVDGLFIGREGDPGRILSWLVRDSSKPFREGPDCWVAHADAEWSRRHLRDPEAEAAMLAEVASVLGVEPFGVRASTLRRWAYARPLGAPLSEPIFDEVSRLGAAGDWAGGGRIEGAFLSGLDLAQRVLGQPHKPS